MRCRSRSLAACLLLLLTVDYLSMLPNYRTALKSGFHGQFRIFVADLIPLRPIWLSGSILSWIGIPGVATIQILSKLHRVPAAELERILAQSKSLMPDLVLRDFSPQQATDWLGYLTSLKAEATNEKL